MKKEIVKVIVVFVITTIILTLSLTVGVNKVNIKSDSSQQAEQYKGVIKLWHIDTFEGGVGSRADFLSKNAVNFEKRNNGVFVLVTTHTIESVNEKILNGEYPDILSYGTGVFPEKVLELHLDKTFYYGNINGKSYAIPWCRGGYAILANADKVSEITKTIKSAVISYSGVTQPLTALCLDGYEVENYTIKQTNDAYYDFVTGKVNYLVGTQRDVHRVKARQMNAIIEPIKNYNDIYQYFSLTSTDSEKIDICESFMKYVLSEQVQRNLVNIGMFSVYNQIDYSDENLKQMQDETNFTYGVNFTKSIKMHEEIFSLSKEVLNGNTEYIKKLKNIVN